MSHIYAPPVQPDQPAPSASPTTKRGLLIADCCRGCAGHRWSRIPDRYQSGSNAADDDRSVAAAAQAAQADARCRRRTSRARHPTPRHRQPLHGGRTIVIDTGSEYGSQQAWIASSPNSGTPTSTQAAIGRTTSLMGVQDDDQDGIYYSCPTTPTTASTGHHAGRLTRADGANRDRGQTMEHGLYRSPPPTLAHCAAARPARVVVDAAAEQVVGAPRDHQAHGEGQVRAADGLGDRAV